MHSGIADARVPDASARKYMLDSALRSLKDRALEPFARGPAGRIHPHVLSLVGLGIGVGCALLLYRREYLAGLSLWLLNRTVDGLDGVVARHRHRQSDLGGYLDILVDFLVYAMIPLAMVLGLPDRGAALPALAVLLASFYINTASWMYLAAVLEKRGSGGAARGEETSVTMPAGLIEGTETVVFYCLFILLPAHLSTWFYAMAALVGITVVQRLAWACRRL